MASDDLLAEFLRYLPKLRIEVFYYYYKKTWKTINTINLIVT